MAENSAIEWTDHTFNPWIGCTKVSPGCDHCYAAAWDARWGNGWGPHQRRRTSPANWRKPLAWDRDAAAAGTRARVFCASLADVFDNDGAITSGWRGDLWHLIHRTPNLDWLLLTKRPQNLARYLCPEEYGNLPPWGDGWPNVWLGTTVENQAEADRRISHLLATPAAVRFLSCEPLLGQVDLEPWLPWPVGGADLADGRPFGCFDCEIGDCQQCPKDRAHYTCEEGPRDADGCPQWITHARETVDWVICGGESGPGARPMHPDWARSLRDQCEAAGVPFFFKQWGNWLHDSQTDDSQWDLEDAEDRGLLHSWPDHSWSIRVRKADAGRDLDGETWDHMPGRAG